MNLSTRQKTILVFVTVSIVVISLIAVALAASGFWVPTDNSLDGNPQPIPTPTATPTPTPTPTATPTPTPTATPIAVIGGVISGNDTDSEDNYIFFRGDTLRITVTLNATVATQIRLYNNGVNIVNGTSNSLGIAVFDRTVNNPYNYSASIFNP